jgi:hypothetical protein
MGDMSYQPGRHELYKPGLRDAVQERCEGFNLTCMATASKPASRPVRASRRELSI